ncbi:hypothetical protein I302_100724 [Kwoniella bestiolae CBS 10118]|uniref:Uncharacterized protein n=1 Tax=Kwoniella bestiolae CBS 10118 TaxID=1296100 RepID=A0A1B9G5V6_9TREE|nr:hypothetical protein I302_04099 [Kwoniella bestiolae CBS 10118]OCF26414.1 hypothetical protein I302_04099 [Kwoniella bestiolae CBS 10118]
MPQPKSVIIDDENYHQPGICDDFTSQFSPEEITDEDHAHATKSFTLTHQIISDPTLSDDTRQSYLKEVITFKNRNFVNPRNGRNALDVYKELWDRYFPEEKDEIMKKGADAADEECSVILPIAEQSSEDESHPHPENASSSASESLSQAASLPTGPRSRISSLGGDVQRRISLIEKNYSSPTAASLARSRPPRSRSSSSTSPTWLSDYADTPSPPGDDRTGYFMKSYGPRGTHSTANKLKGLGLSIDGILSSFPKMNVEENSTESRK